MASSPFLLLPPSEEKTQQTDHLSLYSLSEKKPYQLNLPSILQDLPCLGSSHGWLAFLDLNDNPFLFNPFSNFQINLPPKRTLPCIRGSGPISPHFLSSNIHKVVLSNPHADKPAVMVMYNFEFRTKIAFCQIGDEEWSDLDCKGDTYYDVVFCDQTNTAFALGSGPSIESWDLSECIPKKMKIPMCQDSFELAYDMYPRDLYTSQWYLGMSLGQMFVVMRYIGKFVRYDGEVVYEEDTLTDDAAEPLVCPYKTVDFHVYKHDVDKRKWTKVDSLDNFAMFVGGNQTTMVSSDEHPGLKRNAVYFTDDYWERIDEDYSYGGHDMGIFRLEDGEIEAVLDLELQKIEPPPIWIINSSS